MAPMLQEEGWGGLKLIVSRDVPIIDQQNHGSQPH